MITIFDYGAGNLRSVENTLEEIGAAYTLVRDAANLRKASKIILPGVGHFGQMMRALNRMQVREAFIECIHGGVPFLGICLGLQALFTSSEEAPDVLGLGIFDGVVRRFPRDARVPHMGWNELELRAPSRLFSRIDPTPYVYFAHSYYVPETHAAAAICRYSVPYTAVLDTGSIFGVQFHPEKSGPVGLRIVKNFVEM
jgi:imidazole glycerol phosphate synthase glutamine amidotransferase subunit